MPLRNLSIVVAVTVTYALLGSWFFTGWSWPLLTFGVLALAVTCFLGLTLYVLPEVPPLHVALLRSRLPTRWAKVLSGACYVSCGAALLYRWEFTVFMFYTAAQVFAAILDHQVRAWYAQEVRK